jgi:adenosylcobinamide-GDP ribazoletransferase
MFLTRLPALPHRYLPEALNTSHHYFPVVGLLLGLILGFFYHYSFIFFGNQLVVAFTLAFSVLLTGAFHEDGFADTCDGLGGGFTKERKLEIMKDSRIGTYGSLGLIFLILIKYLFISSFDRSLGFTAILVGQILSRTIILPLAFSLPYARSETEDKPGAGSPSMKKSLIVVFLVWATLFPILEGNPILLVALFTSFFLLLFLSHFYLKFQIGGYTGDTLGAVNQIMEVLVYFSFFILIYSQSIGHPI